MILFIAPKVSYNTKVRAVYIRFERVSELTVATFSSPFQAIADLEANKRDAGSSIRYCDSSFASDGSRRIFLDLALRGIFHLFCHYLYWLRFGVSGCGGLYFLSRSSRTAHLVTVHPHASSVSVTLLMG
jgi:hypothetical protein